MREDCQRRAGLVTEALAACPAIRCIAPEAGMFVIADISATGLTADEFAWRLWRRTGVAVMDGAVFGSSTARSVRISLAVGDARLAEACRRIACFANGASRDPGGWLAQSAAAVAAVP
jgi:arginine:pyruvate transaminase